MVQEEISEIIQEEIDFIPHPQLSILSLFERTNEDIKRKGLLRMFLVAAGIPIALTW